MTAPPRHSLLPARDVDPRQELPVLEQQVLERWRERQVFAESLRLREGAQPWVFYEGPPTANGPPGSHHVLSRVFKDIYPRYKTMRGFHVQRKGGWDCHGLPVEIGVEQELGIGSKAEIEEYGIAKFNARCRESVWAYLEEWNRLTERIGFWIDLEHAYRTLDPDYIESVWWALAQIHAKGLLYEGHKVVPYCPRCGTALSSHEVALGYRDVVDPSVYVRLPVANPSAPLAPGDALLIWTTTPWTLPGNVAVAVSPQAIYIRARVGEQIVVLAEDRVRAVLGEQAQVLERFPGSALVGQSYAGPIFNTGPAGGLPIIAGDFVTTDDGTGLVHIAPAFGEDDYEAAKANGLFNPHDPKTLFNPVNPDGTYDARVRSHGGRSYAGRFVKDPQLTEELISDLAEREQLFLKNDYEHSYPHCWRCGTPLIYYAKASWYIKTTAVRERMLAENDTVGWHPEHVKHGRFGDWLKNNVDWALSRERYWGTPLPVWRCGAGHVHVVGSFSELHALSGVQLEDPHRPFVDDVTFPCSECEQPMTRVPEVIDVWFDSGAMPFAQHHHPFADPGADFAHEPQRFPADFVCEAQDQTRGWFYSLLAISTLLWDTTPYRNVVCLGLILDAEGQKMSKSKGNTVEPWAVLDAYGADAFRWYFFTSKQPWDGYRFSEEAIAEGVRLFLKQLWSTYFFYSLYAKANVDVLTDASAPAEAGEDLDVWALSRTAAVAELVGERLDAYDATTAGRALAELVDELSNWYVRRSRRRFWDGEEAAFTTLRTCLLTVAKLLAPFCPFIADEIYDNLDGTLASVHLCDFPSGTQLPSRDPGLEEAMAIARETVRLGLAARGQAKIKVRQPLAEAVVVATGRERAAIERLADIVREELNVRRVRFVAGAEELGEYEVKANYRTLGPRFGKDMPRVADAIAGLDPAHVASAVREGRELGINVNGHDHTLAPEDLLLSMRAPEGYSVEREGAHAVALDLAIDADLQREGRAREIVHAVQNARKNAGLQVEDRIELGLSGDAALIEAAAAHRDYLSGETLSVDLRLGEDDAPAAMDHREQTVIDGLALNIDLHRAERV
ncbi:MAG TPA: isoleucine--tRNA ligase [Solirubrobacteraceae bacterium]|nr:isoleucine--tRNA ligase [Solirubrobacteraceae bacterium]